MVKAIVGANWGDEGKGKITDMLAEQSDVVIRFQGGANAGHTIINDYGRFALHILPSGTFYPHVTNIIGNGVALDIQKLVDELGSLPEAIQYAGTLAKLKQYDLKLVEPELSAREKLLQQLMGQASALLSPSIVEQLAATLGLDHKVLAPLQRLDDPRGIYALSPLQAP